jgi:CheY-like chemotaxis protein
MVVQSLPMLQHLPPPCARTDAGPLVLVVDADRATRDLLDEWLAGSGYRVAAAEAEAEAEAEAGAGAGAASGGAALIVVDLPFPRQGGQAVLQRLAAQHPGVPILALSSTFFASVACTGAVARELGVAGVLPKPIRRDALVAAVTALAGTGPGP